MAVPINLVLVRHGESEGNVASRRSKRGDDSDYTPEFLTRHSSRLRLSNRGRRQAVAAGEWLRTHLNFKFHRDYVSDYIRAKETAALLALPNENWYVSFYLRERDWGVLDTLPVSKRNEYAEYMRFKETDGLYWTPLNGVSIADVCLRIDRVLATLHRECSDKNVLVVCHGEVMWAFRVILERMTSARFQELDSSKNPFDRIHNCQILHYTRDAGRGVRHHSYHKMRSICPWDTSRSNNEWQEIVRPKFTNEALMQEVQAQPRLIKE